MRSRRDHWQEPALDSISFGDPPTSTHPPSAIRHPPSATHHPPTHPPTSTHPPSAMRHSHPPSAIRQAPAPITHPPSASHQPPVLIRHPPATSHQPPPAAALAWAASAQGGCSMPQAPQPPCRAVLDAGVLTEQPSLAPSPWSLSREQAGDRAPRPPPAAALAWAASAQGGCSMPQAPQPPCRAVLDAGLLRATLAPPLVPLP